MAFYVIRQLQLDRSPVPSVLEQPLELENSEELSSLLAASRKSPETGIETQ
jgi:hypothetical protein